MLLKKEMAAIAVRLCGMLACVLFLATDAKLAYVFFARLGADGWMARALNTAVVHLLFLTVFCQIFGAGRNPRIAIAASGGLLSCGAAWYAGVWANLGEHPPFSPYGTLFLIPLILTAIPLIPCARKEFPAPCRWAFFLAATVFLLIQSLIPVVSCLIWRYALCSIVVVTLIVLQLRQYGLRPSELLGVRVRLSFERLP